jgi:hypothetical protein
LRLKANPKLESKKLELKNEVLTGKKLTTTAAIEYVDLFLKS